MRILLFPVFAAIAVVFGCQTTPLTYRDVNPAVEEPRPGSFAWRLTVESFFGLPRYENAVPAPRGREKAFGK